MRYVFLLVLLCNKLYAQHVFWIQLKDKDSSFTVLNPEQFLSEKAISRRHKFNIPIVTSDLPLSTKYVQEITQKGLIVLSKSKWLNGLTVLAPKKSYQDSFSNMQCVERASYLGEYKPVKYTKAKSVDIHAAIHINDLQDKKKLKYGVDSSFYGKSYTQLSMLNTPILHQQGYRGEGIEIAVIDAGFNNVDKLPVFKSLFNNHQVKGTYDFVQKHQSVYEDDEHGMAVLSCMAGNLANEYVGTAPAANYHLLRTEDASTEMPIEEFYWIEAIEYADSIGVDLVNSSLGYNEFDDESFNHTYKELNGVTIGISKAASMAVQKGMLVLVSAGNEGDNNWKFMSVPADAAEVITVGAVDSHRNFVLFSSIGPTSDKRIKPDLMAQGDNVWIASHKGSFYQGDGTSYSCPIMAGSVACLMQAYPTKKPTELITALHLSGHNYVKPNYTFGYGVPDMYLAYLLLQNDTSEKLLDITYLNDNRLHVTYRAGMSHIINIAINDDKERIVHVENLSVNGITRAPLKKNKHLKKGKYSLHIISENYKWVQPFNIP